MKVGKIATLAGLQAENKESWSGKVLLFGPEFHKIREDDEISHVEYDPKDGRPPIILSADKIRTVHGKWRKTKKNSKWFKIYEEKDVIL